MTRRLLVTCMFATMWLLLVVGTASADNEPANNVFTGAEGPLQGGVAVKSRIGAIGDQDWHYFYVTATGDFSVSSNAYTVFYQYSGGALSEKWYDMDGASGAPRQLQPGLYYILIYKTSAPRDYSLTVNGPTSALAPDVANTHRQATPLPEIYEDAKTGYSVAQLLVPYAANTASYGADGDVDWYKFYVTGTCDVTVGMWAPPYLTACAYTDPTKPEFIWFNSDRTASTTRQLPRGVYYLRFDDGRPVNDYTFTVQGSKVSLDYPCTASRPAVVGRALSSRSTKFVGRVNPRRSVAVRVEIRRYSAGKYRAYKTLGRTSKSTGDWVLLSKLRKGTYRIRVKTPASPGLTSSTSPWRRVIVR